MLQHFGRSGLRYIEQGRRARQGARLQYRLKDFYMTKAHPL